MSELKLRPGAAPASGFFSGKRRYLLLLLLALAALVCWRLFIGGGQARKGMNMEMPPVRVAPSLAQNVPHFLNGLGTVLPSSDVLVTSRVDGQLQRLHFQEGQRVRGQLGQRQPCPRSFFVTGMVGSTRFRHQDCVL